MAAKKILGNIQTLEANGGAMTNGVFATANDNAYNDQNGDYPLVYLHLSCTLGTTQATAGEVINIYEQELEIAGVVGDDAPVPDTSYKQKYVGSFVLDNISTLQDLSAIVPAPAGGKCNYILENACATGDVDAGWKLEGYPLTYEG